MTPINIAWIVSIAALLIPLSIHRIQEGHVSNVSWDGM